MGDSEITIARKSALGAAGPLGRHRRADVVTADHGHTSRIIDPQTTADHSPGAISVLTTDEGSPMTINDATNLHGRPQSHTGTEVRVAAQGRRPPTCSASSTSPTSST